MVVLAAHPDDEVLGTGGILSLLASAGVRLRLIAVTDGEASHPGHADPGELIRRRCAERAAALRELGAAAAEVIRLRLPDAGLGRREPELATLVGPLVTGFGACLAPWENDVHADHEAVGRAARQACPRLFFYPVWMWHWARPGDPRVPWAQAIRVPLPAAAADAQTGGRSAASPASWTTGQMAWARSWSQGSLPISHAISSCCSQRSADDCQCQLLRRHVRQLT